MLDKLWPFFQAAGRTLLIAVVGAVITALTGFVADFSAPADAGPVFAVAVLAARAGLEGAIDYLRKAKSALLDGDKIDAAYDQIDEALARADAEADQAEADHQEDRRRADESYRRQKEAADGKLAARLDWAGEIQHRDTLRR